MKKIIKALALASALLCCSVASAQSEEYDVLVPIGKYIIQGNTEALSAWFADNLDISILARQSNASRAQAKQIIKAFFTNYTPRSFTITHTAGRDNMKYILGDLYAGGETFRMTLFVCCKGRNYEIQQIKIDRI